MAIYLVQHGKAFSKDEDPERKLTPAGSTEVKKTAEILKKNTVRITKIIHSGKKRAAQTANIFNEILKPESGISQQDHLTPNDDVEIIAKTLQDNHNTMFVGHLPYMEKMVSFLITGTTEKPVLKFKNGGVVCLEQIENSGCWIIKWMVYPNCD